MTKVAGVDVDVAVLSNERNLAKDEHPAFYLFVYILANCLDRASSGTGHASAGLEV